MYNYNVKTKPIGKCLSNLNSGYELKRVRLNVYYFILYLFITMVLCLDALLFRLKY